MGEVWRRGEFTVSTDNGRLDLELVHATLAAAYWAAEVPRAVVERSIERSLAFGLYHAQLQIGFGRLITDRATLAYFSDVFVAPEFRGRGLGHWLVSCMMAHPEVQGLRRWLLVTRDAHGFYREHGFVQLADPTQWMEIADLDIHRRGGERR